MIPRHRLPLNVRLAIACVLVFATILGLASVPASAKIVHSFEGSFEGSDAPGGPFGLVLSDAADTSGGTSNGDVYVGELDGSLESFVDKFDAQGKYAGVQITGAETPQGSLSMVSLSTFRTGGVAVDSLSGANMGDVYVAATGAGVVDKFSEAGAFICQLTAKPSASRSVAEAEHECDGAKGSETRQGSIEPTAIAVDPSGDVYVIDAAHEVLDEFSPSGEYVSQIADSHIEAGASSLAFGSTGNLYLANSDSDVVEFDQTGVFSGVINSESPVGVGIDSANGHLYVGVTYPTERIAEYDPSGDLLDWFGEGHVGRAASLAVGPAGRVYVANLFAKEVTMFGPDVLVPDVAVGVTEDQGTNATLTGSVDPAGGPEVTECKFEYGPTTSYGQTTACSPGTSYTSPTDVTAHITGLTEGSTYHFRIVAANANGVDAGEDHQFGPPAVVSASASAVTTRAIVAATINPLGIETTCLVQYVDEAEFKASGYSFAASAPCASPVGWEAGEQSASVTLTGLGMDTKYHYRVLAISGAGTATGPDQTFATFGIESFSLSMLDGASKSFTQAGGHPYELIDSFALNTSTNRLGLTDATDANPKDLRVELPPGLIGNPNAVSKCSPYDVAHADCSGASQVGVLKIYTSKEPGGKESPIYNLVPPKGLAAQFGARFNGFVTVHIDARVRTGGDYGVTAEVLNSSADEGVIGATVKMWGEPAEERHDIERYCPAPKQVNEVLDCSERGRLVPFLTDPTSCTGPLSASMHVDSWQEPEGFAGATSEVPAMTGCGRLDFDPTITAQPEGGAGASATGLNVDLHVPQIENPTGVSEADLKDATVTLPQGMTVNPSGAAGLVGCSEAQIELHGAEPAQCPEASKIGSVEIETPLVEHPLKGGVYVAQQGNAGSAQGSNPFGSLLAIYIAVDDPQTGVVVKLAGQVTINPETGQIATRFDENPQLPFKDLKLDFFGGGHAALATPAICGAYKTTTLFEPWSHYGVAGETGTPDAEPSSPFSITSGPGGGLCSSVGAFMPAFVAGTTNNQAAAFAAFSMNLTRKDGERMLSTVALTMPPGLEGDVSSVALCPEAQANVGDCSAASKIGYVRVSAGVGKEPIVLPEASKPEDPVYLTESYDGAPFGLSVVVPAEAGLFNLDEGGHPIVVRAKIEVDPHTAQVSVVSNPMPTRLQGIPLDMRDVEVVVDRPGFIFNPTNCNATSVAGTIGSSEGASESVSSRFQAANCATLPFKPSFTAATSATHTRNGGDSLRIVVKSSAGEANIAAARVELPKSLPSRLSTLNKACPEATFAANPAACPAGSRIGTAIAYTSILSVPLSGPAYFVSHGGAKFPELILVLQGEGVTVQLNGETFISSKGITSSTFKSVPDVPVTRFELILPAGSDSVLTATGEPCAEKLVMPTAITGQNGAVIEQSTQIVVSGCKPAIRVLRHSVEGDTATIVASLPFAGKLVASGDGLSRVVRKLKKASRVTLELALTKTDRSLLAHRRGRELKVSVRLRLTPNTGKSLSRSVTVLIG